MKLHCNNAIQNTSNSNYLICLWIHNTVGLIECGDGTYVFDDKCVKCHGLCKDSAPCNKSTGNCDNGCNDHWTGNFCDGMLFYF